MPYIKQQDRDRIVECKLQPDMSKYYVIDTDKIDNAGELQYAIAIMIKEYIKRKDNNYQTRNDIMGALAGAQMEFYRRHIIPYEDEKIEINGDV